MGISITTIAISFFLGYLLMRRPVEEIIKISTNMRNMQKHKDFDQQLVVSGYDEISDLANSFNDMINERMRAVKQIHVLYHAVEQSPVTIVITDIDANIEYVNPRFTQLTGYTLEEAIGNNPRILKSGKTPPEVYIELWKTIRSGSEWRGVFCNRKKSGELYWEDALISPVKDDKGVITNFIAVKDDITEQKRILDALKESEEKYSKLIETAKDAIICDLNGTITDWNNSAEEVFGYSKNEIIGKQIEILIPDRYKKEHQEGLERFLKTGEARIIGKTVEVSGITKEGFEIPIEISLTAQKIKEEKYLFTAFIRDLTERKKIEEALFQSEKLKSLGTITAGIAHDFSNILAVISGKAQLLEMDYESNKELTDELSDIMKAIDDGVEISSRMLKFTKTEKDTTGFVSYDIRDLLTESIDFTMPRWKNMAHTKGINYHIDKECIKQVPAILCNPTEIRETFINIINNALDAMPEGGSILFSTWSGDDTVFVDISDTGEGMHKDVKKRIFDPFYSTKGVTGTGLGMSMAYGIITRHGGKIEVESEVGKGSTFKLQFPIATKTVRSIVSPEPEQAIKNKDLRILVVDDEEVICNILDKFLSKAGHKVKTVDNGADAIELMKREEFDLVLCDLAMPNVIGYDVIKALNDLEKRPKIGIITGWGEKLKAIDGEGMKIDFIFKKPFNLSMLTKHINDAFGTDSRC